MRSQVPTTGQSQRGSSSSSSQKKSVFDRLGRQLDNKGRRSDSKGRPSPSNSAASPPPSSSMKRRPSPGQYGGAQDYMPSPPMHEPDGFGCFGPRDMPDYDWRYQQERGRHISFGRDNRHPGQMGPGPGPPQMQPMPPPPSHYDIDIGPNGGVNRSGYYQGPHPYHGGLPQGPPQGSPQSMGGTMIIPQQQRSSPKYDRHGNLITGSFKDRVGGPPLMDHHPGMSPSRGFMPGPMMHPGHPHDMPPDMRGPPSMYGGPSSHRWPEGPCDPDGFPLPPHASGRLMQHENGGRFSPAGSRRYQQQQQQLPPQQMMNTADPNHHHNSEQGPRYTKWRERRDVITNLDRETAQSSSRTDSLKSTLQQQDHRLSARQNEPNLSHDKRATQTTSKQQQQLHPNQIPERSKNDDTKTSLKERNKLSVTKDLSAKKTDPQDISDGEIVDDEDSSDDSDAGEEQRTGNNVPEARPLNHTNAASNTKVKTGAPTIPYSRSRDSLQQYYESSMGKKRRLLEREEYSMDYETISDDDDLDDFMDDSKKVSGLASDGTKLDNEESGKSSSEIELLNALGLDWANLVEVAKQSKSSSYKENHTPGLALSRFSAPNYLPTLGITKELAGPELYDLIVEVCRFN